MKRGLVFGVMALLGLATTAMAGLPCAAYSSCALSVVNSQGCNQCDMIWSPGATTTADYMVINVTVRDCLENPVATCDVQLDLSGSFDANGDLSGTINGKLCGPATRTAQTDANGVASFEITGGGSGAVMLDWTVTALCADPTVEICANSDTLCAKSFDYDGTLGINFFDTFKYLAGLGAGSSYSSDFASCSGANAVNFFDTFRYLAHLGAPDACAGANTPLTLVDGVVDCDALFN
jgi:hypothetical protein